MLNIATLFGTISGLIVVTTIIASIIISGTQITDNSVYVGYLIMIIALSMVFFGIKRYRDQELGGVIKFLPAFMTGLAITLVAGIIYVMVWEVYEASTDYAFIDTYISAMIDAKRAAGEPADSIAAMTKEMEELKSQYQNPLFRLPMTFMEIFPVGLLISLISAAILRNSKILPART